MRPVVKRRLERLTGFVLVGLGVRLAFDPGNRPARTGPAELPAMRDTGTNIAGPRPKTALRPPQLVALAAGRGLDPGTLRRDRRPEEPSRSIPRGAEGDKLGSAG